MTATILAILHADFYAKKQHHQDAVNLKHTTVYITSDQQQLLSSF